MYSDFSRFSRSSGNPVSIAQSVEHLLASSHTVRQQWHDRSQFQAPPMPAGRYVEQNSSASMLATKRLAGITQEVNLREDVPHMPLCQAHQYK